MYLDLITYLLSISCAVYIILAEKGIVKMLTEKQQLEFDERMRNKGWRYTTLTRLCRDWANLITLAASFSLL